MNKRRLSVLLLCLAAGGCAHGEQSSADRARARDSDKVASNDRDERAERGKNVDREHERVDIPEAKKDRGRMASAGDEIPAEDQPNANLPSSAESYGTQPDNTRFNERDRETSALTPFDQGGGEDDRELTQRIRKAVVGEDGLSFTAKNVKIITREGQVTLRGTVKSQEERTTIERLATAEAGPNRVVNQLEVAD